MRGNKTLINDSNKSVIGLNKASSSLLENRRSPKLLVIVTNMNGSKKWFFFSLLKNGQCIIFQY